jgi:DNA-binding transcriptional regulator PaaX
MNSPTPSRDWIAFLLWFGTGLCRPSLHTWLDTYESWAERNGLRMVESRLRRSGRITREQSDQGWITRLTDAAVAAAAAPPDPESRWARPWDGTWTVLSYDMATRLDGTRTRLNRTLRDTLRLGHLQGSVWISPEPLQDLEKTIHSFGNIIQRFFLIRGGFMGGPSPEDIVAQAWPLKEISTCYDDWTVSVRRLEKAILAADPADTKSFDRVMTALGEQESLWNECLRRDPLLPRRLCPADYPGFAALKQRQHTMQLFRKRFAPKT